MARYFEPSFIYVYRHSINLKDHPANFIRNCGPGEDPNCELVWGKDESLEACIFVRALGNIGQGYEILLREHGIGDIDTVFLRKRFLSQYELRVSNDINDAVANLFDKLLEDQWTDEKGLILTLDRCSENRQMLNALFQRTGVVLSFDELKESLSAEALFKAHISYDARQHYDRTSGNGLCFQNSIYQSILRIEDPTNFENVATFPRCQEYIELYQRAKDVVIMNEVFQDASFVMAMSDIDMNFDFNFEDLCNGKQNGYVYGNLKSFATALAIYPKKRTPQLFFLLFEENPLTRNNAHFQTQLYSLSINPLHINGFFIISHRLSEVKALFTSVPNFIFFGGSHYWLPAEEPLAILPPTAVDSAFDRLVQLVLEAINVFTSRK